jgi:sulfur-carrier protein adenylyltransferase/sulfurtransferase
MKDFYVRKRYIFLSSLSVIMGAVLLFLPSRKNFSELNPEKLLLEVIDNARFISSDEVAKMLIIKDPSVQLIDVRDPEEFVKFNLPGSINIPLKNILDKEQADALNQEVKKNIFYSNGTIYANQAWLLTRRLGYKNNYILNGGLNLWMETIMRPEKPKMTAGKDEFALYEFRKAASSYLGGGSNSSSTSSAETKSTDTKTAPVKKSKKSGSSGGC